MLELNLHNNKFLFCRCACTECSDKVSYKASKQFVKLMLIISCSYRFLCAANHLGESGIKYLFAAFLLDWERFLEKRRAILELSER